MLDLVEDEQLEFGDTEAREMVLNNEGTLLLTSSNSGSVSVWSLPKLNLVYRLHSDEFVRDLTFSPDAQYIYDVRGSGCNVWAPDVLVRPDDADREETSSSFDGSSVSEVFSEPVYSQDHSSECKITALVGDDEDEYFCCGRDDGSVSIHSVVDGKRVRKVSSHSTTADVICIGWSSSRRYLVSADDSGKIIMKRLRIKEDGKWAVFPVLELRVDEAVLQLLFNPEESLLLVSTNLKDFIWEIKTKNQVHKKVWQSAPGRRWLNYPGNPSQLIQLWPDQQVIFNWTSPNQPVHTASDPISEEAISDTNDPVPSLILTGPVDDQGTVSSVVFPSSNNYMVVESSPRMHSLTSRSARAKWDLISVKDPTSIKRKTLLHLETEVQRLLGCYHDRLVFLDHMNWICTCIIGWEMGPIKRHFFLPRDWVNALALGLMAFNKKGTLLCARESDVAVVQYTKGF
ncbi:WD40-repeat-containing domain protein [Xylaria venustula]|nr:WD40-repeat-containing domain protein [Xylaria venustula]